MIDTSNTLRVSGLASGMNTDEIVANLVKVQSSRLNKMQQSKTLATWKTDAYRDVNKKVNDFYNAMKDLRLESTINKKTASSSNESVVSATVSGVPNLSSYEIKVVDQAKPPIAASVKFFGTDLDTTKTLSQLGVTEDTTGSGTTSLSINGITPDFKFNINDTLSTVLNEITSKTPLTVTYSSTEKSLTFTNDLPGAGDITIDGSTTFLDALGIKPGSTIDSYKNQPDISAVTGTNKVQAKMLINGLEFRSETNTITYDGMTFEIKSSMAADESLSITTKSDTDAVFTSIKTFVDKYNELISDLNGKLTEKKYRDYPPLLDDQKKDMKDTDIKLWDEKAKSGLLAGDSTIQSFLTQMRNSLMTVVGDPSVSPNFTTLKSIGINFSTSYRDNGKLVLDEEKLKGVLKTNLEDVKKLFTTKDRNAAISKTTANDKELHDFSGFGWRIYDRLNETITQLGSIAGSLNSTVDTKSFMAKQIKSLDANIYNEQDKVNAYEQRLWKQFGAMEKAIQQLNSQGSWLSQQLGM